MKERATEVESIGKPTPGPITSHGDTLKKFSQLIGLKLHLATEIGDEKIVIFLNNLIITFFYFEVKTGNFKFFLKTFHYYLPSSLD